MLKNIFETIIIGSNTEFLDIPKKEFFLKYDNLNIKSAQEVADDYFNMKKKNVISYVKDINVDDTINKINITVQVEKNNKKNENTLLSYMEDI